MNSVSYGQKSIYYNLIFSDRKTLEIAVHPDCSVIVKAPFGTLNDLIRKKIIKRARWIIEQQKFFRQFSPRTPERSYINGESHQYLGKKYRLRIITSPEDSVKLFQGLFLISCQNSSTPEKVKKLMKTWYQNKARIKFEESLTRCWQKFDHIEMKKPIIVIKQMQKRWGGLSDKGIMTLNPDLIKTPKECIDYVVTHELCHLENHDHSSEFYNRLETIMPDWKSIKHKLELATI